MKSGYRLTNDLIERMGRHRVDSLEQEILLAKASLESRLESVKTEAEKIALFPYLLTALAQIDRLVTDNRKHQEQTSQTLTKTALMQFAKGIVDIVVSHIRDIPNFEERADAISKEIAELLAKTENVDEKPV